MRKSAILLLAAVPFLLMPCAIVGQTPAEIERAKELAKENDTRQEELVNIEHDVARAIQWNNGTIFRRIYGDDFLGVLPSGQVKDKNSWIAMIENPNIKYTSFLATDIRVRMFQETAVVTSLWSARGTRDGQPFYKQFRVTHVYVYGQRGWQVIASQETLLPG